MNTKGTKWGFPKIRGTILGVPIIRTMVFWGLYWGPPILGNYQIWPESKEIAGGRKSVDLYAERGRHEVCCRL